METEDIDVRVTELERAAELAKSPGRSERERSRRGLRNSNRAGSMHRFASAFRCVVRVL
jgi:hypothetical protein